MAGDNLPKGYKYCDCHPETCCHEGGVKFVGEKAPFKVDESDRDRLEFSKDFLNVDEAIVLMSYYDMQVSTTYSKNKLIASNGDVSLSLETFYSYRISEHTVKYFFLLRDVVQFILDFKSAVRKGKYQDFLEAL
jgi:hypothetical protein